MTESQRDRLSLRLYWCFLRSRNPAVSSSSAAKDLGGRRMLKWNPSKTDEVTSWWSLPMADEVLALLGLYRSLKLPLLTASLMLFARTRSRRKGRYIRVVIVVVVNENLYARKGYNYFFYLFSDSLQNIQPDSKNGTFLYNRDMCFIQRMIWKYTTYGVQVYNLSHSTIQPTAYCYTTVR